MENHIFRKEYESDKCDKFHEHLVKCISKGRKPFISIEERTQ